MKIDEVAVEAQTISSTEKRIKGWKIMEAIMVHKESKKQRKTEIWMQHSEDNGFKESQDGGFCHSTR